VPKNLTAFFWKWIILNCMFRLLASYVKTVSTITNDTAVLLYTEHRTLITATGISNIAFLLVDCEWYCGMQVPAAVQ
jgi:hypothetical protein